MNHAETISSNLADTAALPQPDIKPLQDSLTQLELIAALEDERLETSYYSSAAKRRRQHAVALMRLGQHPSLPSAIT